MDTSKIIGKIEGSGRIGRDLREVAALSGVDWNLSENSVIDICVKEHGGSKFLARIGRQRVR